MNKQDRQLYIYEIQTDVNLISFLIVISVFFLGSLLPKFTSYDLSIKIPVSFLIISTFAFIFSALILSNAVQKIIHAKFDEAGRYLDIGYAISEYLGVFLLILSLPLIVNIITADVYLRTVTFLSSILGMGIYQFMGFSLLENHFSKNHHLFSIMILLFSTILFFSQIYNFYFTLIAIAFLLFILLITILAPIKRFR